MIRDGGMIYQHVEALPDETKVVALFSMTYEPQDWT